MAARQRRSLGHSKPMASAALVRLNPLRRPLVDAIKGSTLSYLKELPAGSTGATEVRLLFVFDPGPPGRDPGGRRQGG